MLTTQIAYISLQTIVTDEELVRQSYKKINIRDINADKRPKPCFFQTHRSVKFPKIKAPNSIPTKKSDVAAIPNIRLSHTSSHQKIRKNLCQMVRYHNLSIIVFVMAVSCIVYLVRDNNIILKIIF